MLRVLKRSFYRFLFACFLGLLYPDAWKRLYLNSGRKGLFRTAEFDYDYYSLVWAHLMVPEVSRGIPCFEIECRGTIGLGDVLMFIIAVWDYRELSLRLVSDCRSMLGHCY